METHYYVSNSLCYAKGDTAEQATSRLEMRATAFNPDKELPITIIQVLAPIETPYSLAYFLPEKVRMVIEQQDYESNVTIGEVVFFEDGILYYGEGI